MIRRMQTLFDGYDSRQVPRRHVGQPWDEMFPAAGQGTGVREPYRELITALERLDDEELRARTEALASSYLAQGVTFDFAGEERPFPLDVVPRVIAADGTPTRVTGVFPQGQLDEYEVEFSDGAVVRCSEDHLWTVRHARGATRSKPIMRRRWKSSPRRSTSAS